MPQERSPLQAKPNSPFAYHNTHDGLLLRYGCWPCEGRKTKGRILLLNGRAEFMEKYFETIAELNGRGFDVVSLDWRGQGLSGRLLADGHKGHVNTYEDYLADLKLLVQNLGDFSENTPLFILAHSMGAHIALRFLHDHPGAINRAVLVAPMFEIAAIPLPAGITRLGLSLAIKAGQQNEYVWGTHQVGAAHHRFESNRVTSDRARYEKEQRLVAENPALYVGAVTYGWLAASFDSIAILRGKSYCRGVRNPVLLVNAGADKIVSRRAQLRVAKNLPDCHFETIDGARHEILMEADCFRKAFWRLFDRFMS